jgi:hypothetical protein
VKSTFTSRLPVSEANLECTPNVAEAHFKGEDNPSTRFQIRQTGLVGRFRQQSQSELFPIASLHPLADIQFNSEGKHNHTSESVSTNRSIIPGKSRVGPSSASAKRLRKEISSAVGPGFWTSKVALPYSIETHDGLKGHNPNTVDIGQKKSNFEDKVSPGRSTPDLNVLQPSSSAAVSMNNGALNAWRAWGGRNTSNDGVFVNATDQTLNYQMHEDISSASHVVHC